MIIQDLGAGLLGWDASTCSFRTSRVIFKHSLDPAETTELFRIRLSHLKKSEHRGNPHDQIKIFGHGIGRA